jgi:murein DD-endopeptidase MepM/ murein hydrolase activator NlpD
MEALATFIARIRIPLLAIAGLMILLGVFIDQRWLSTAGFIVLIVGLALYFRVGTVRGEALLVRPPVVGRWVPVNSPGTRVPSHWLHAWGQTYAIDLIHTPTGGYKPEFGWRPLSRPADTFSSVGQPVVAPTTGTVVRAYDKARDHRSRTSWPGLIYLLFEGALRELGGPKRLLGNHVVIDLGDGTYAAMAIHDRGRLAIPLQRHGHRERAAKKQRGFCVRGSDRELARALREELRPQY